jgi:phage terminase large subunit
VQLAHRVAALAERLGAHAIFVDETGVGAGVIDQLRALGFRHAQGVNNGAKADRTTIDGELVANKGAECWAAMRSWLKSGGAIPNDADLRQQLEGRDYGYNVHNEIVLERKDDMKKRGLASPDRADALALTFAYPVASPSAQRREAARAVSDWNPYENSEP